MDDWVKYSGHPVLHIQQKEIKRINDNSNNNERGKIEITYEITQKLAQSTSNSLSKCKVKRVYDGKDTKNEEEEDEEEDDEEDEEELARKNDTNYTVFLLLKTRSGKEVIKQVIDTPSKQITVECEDENDWVKFNWGHTGFYR